MKIAYARVSTDDQHLELQTDALNGANCDRIYTDKITGAKMNRPGLNQIKEVIRPGDTLVVWRLDRLGRSLKELIEIVTWLEDQNIGLISLTESIDTTTPTGKLIFHIFGAIAEFERNLIRERTNAGLKAARARGRFGGRPVKLNNEKKKAIKSLYDSKQHSIKELCEMFEISKPTLYSYIQ